eukprot:4464118-Heterocapsa_arctica.AAC.1
MPCPPMVVIKLRMVSVSHCPSAGWRTPSLRVMFTAWLTTAVMALRRCLSRMAPGVRCLSVI